MRTRILHIFNTIAAKHQRPIRLGIRLVLGQDLLIYPHGFVIFIAAPKMIGSIIKICPPIIIQFGQGLLGAAAVANSYGVTGVKFQCPSAHFAFEYCH